MKKGESGRLFRLRCSRSSSCGIRTKNSLTAFCFLRCGSSALSFILFLLSSTLSFPLGFHPQNATLGVRLSPEKSLVILTVHGAKTIPAPLDLILAPHSHSFVENVSNSSPFQLFSNCFTVFHGVLLPVLESCLQACQLPSASSCDVDRHCTLSSDW